MAERAPRRQNMGISISNTEIEWALLRLQRALEIDLDHRVGMQKVIDFLLQNYERTEAEGNTLPLALFETRVAKRFKK